MCTRACKTGTVVLQLNALLELVRKINGMIGENVEMLKAIDLSTDIIYTINVYELLH